MSTPGFPWSSQQGREVCLREKELDWYCLKRPRVCFSGGRWFCCNSPRAKVKEGGVVIWGRSVTREWVELGWVCSRHNEVWHSGSSSRTPCCCEWNRNLLSSSFPFFPYREPILQGLGCFTNPRRAVVPKRTLAARLLSRRPTHGPCGKDIHKGLWVPLTQSIHYNNLSSHQNSDSLKQIMLTKFTTDPKTELWTLCCEAWIIPQMLEGSRYPNFITRQ